MEMLNYKKIRYTLDQNRLFDMISTVLFFSPFKTDCPSEHRDYYIMVDSFSRNINIFDNNGNLEKVSLLIENLTAHGTVEFEREYKWCDKHKNTIYYKETAKCVMCSNNV